MIYLVHMQKKNLITGVAVAAGLLVVALFFVFGNPLDFVNNNPLSAASNDSSPQSLVVQDEVVGTGAEAHAGDTVSVNYTGKLQDGTVFDTSLGKAPIEFPLGSGYVIPGWDQGLVGMKVGGKRLLIVPPSLAYGAQDYGPIPGNSTLVFEVELVKVTTGSATPPAVQ